jgi:hypothetical protein
MSTSSIDDVEKKEGIASHYEVTTLHTGNIDERKLVNKIDWHVLPFICVMYLLAFLDRYAPFKFSLGRY